MKSRGFILMLFGCLVVFLALRLRWMGHLLMWDEAMNLCTMRSFASGGHDAYSDWFWRYPPLFNTLLLLFHPLQAGFMQRAEWLPIIVGVLQLAVLAELNRRVFGTAIALWACLAFSVMPGSVFFGLWLKQDGLVAVFGLLAILLCTHKKWLWSGLALGLAFLSKEVALFYAIGIALILVTERRYREVAAVAAVSFGTSVWWYAGFSIAVHRFFLQMAGQEPNPMGLWDQPWYYFGPALLKDLGGFGLALAVAGGCLVCRAKGPRLWPVAVFVPAFLAFTASQYKTPWYLISMLPALATLEAVALCELWKKLSSRFPAALPGRAVPAVASVAAALILAWPLQSHSYESLMREKEPGMWAASTMSREAAETLNDLVKDGESALVTPMHYYEGHVDTLCPIFVIYLKDMPIIVRPNTLSAQAFAETVRAYDIDWAMVSPAPEQAATNLFNPLARDFGLRPTVLRGSLVYRTTRLKTPPSGADNP